MTDGSSTLRYWLAQLHGGDPEARNELMRHSRVRLRLLVYQMLRRFPRVQQLEDLSDVLQNVLIRLDRALQAVVVTSSLDFLRLATAQIRRELIDLARYHFGPQGAAAYLLPPGFPEEHPPPEPPSRGDDPLRLAQWAELHEEIAALPDQEREVFELLYYQGLAQPEAAELLGVSLRTLKRRWQGARLLLMDHLGDDLPL